MFLHYNIQGNIQGFYSSEIHGDNIPTPKIEISTSLWQWLLENQGKKIKDESINKDTLQQEDFEDIAIPIEQIKAKKIQELNSACTTTIILGFEYTQNNTTYLLGFDEQDQANLTQQMAILDISPEPIVWKVKGELVFLQFTRDEFKQMGLVAKQHKESKMQRYYQLCSQVQVCETSEEVEAITW